MPEVFSLQVFPVVFFNNCPPDIRIFSSPSCQEGCFSFTLFFNPTPSPIFIFIQLPAKKGTVKKFAFLLILSLLPFLTACGGGGSGDQTVPGDEGEPSFRSEKELYTISGTVRASMIVFDGDTDDENAPFHPNNSLETAQIVPNGAKISGYVKVAGAGSQGQSFLEGDVFDVYAVDLTAGQVILLVVAEPDRADLDLFLGNAGGELLQASQGIEAIESVQVPSDGTHYITVQATEGASGYLLLIGDGNEAAVAAPSMAITQDFVPGDIVVRYREEPSLLSASGDRSQPPGLRRKGGEHGRAMLFELPDSVSLMSSAGKSPHPLVDEGRPEINRKMETIRVIKDLRRNPEVRFAEPNYLVQPHFVPNDKHYPIQWHYPLIRLPEAWDLTRGTPETVVAVVDSGILFGHPDLAPNLLDGYDFISDPDRAGDGDGIDPDPSDDGDSLPVGSTSYHGTHVAGTIAAATNNATGVAGVAGNVRIMPLRALSMTNGVSYDLAQAILYAAGLTNDTGSFPEKTADVINMSLGSSYPSRLIQDACIRAREAGVILVASAGNESSSTPFYPAAFKEVISVSGVTLRKELASYSNFGSTITVAAPGGEMGRDVDGDGYQDGILSTSWNGGNYSYTFLSGTSMAAPHVSGVAALMRSLHPSMTPDQLDALLSSGDITEDIGPSGRDDYFGYGLIDACKAALAARQLALEEDSTPPAQLSADPESFTFSESRTAAPLRLENTGGGELNVISLVSSASWLTVTATAAEPDSGLGDYMVLVDPTKMNYGENTAAIEVKSDNGDLLIPVTAFKKIQAAAASEGFLYVVLTDASGVTVAQTEGGYGMDGMAFSLSDLAPGSYRLFVGTDADGDLTICDPGEICGAYSALQSADEFLLDSDRSGMDLILETGILAKGSASQKISPPKRLR